MLEPSTSKSIQPFVKWAGGKRQLLNILRKYIPSDFNTYFEPFIGGGAVLFDLKPPKAVINDLNSELINVYQTIKNNCEELITDLHSYDNTPEHFYAVREIDRDGNFRNTSNIKKASRIIYLNKTCFNGLFRVNRSGHFNVPFGSYKDPNIINESTLRAVSKYLNSNDVKILNVDFEEAITEIKSNDFVYFDPPYDPLNEISSFTGYTFKGFGRNDQVRLKLLCDNLNKKEIRFLLSNSATPFVLDLFKNYKVEIIQANRSINSVADKRGKINEVLIRNY